MTAWLRPKRGGEVDAEGARTLGATPPLQRTYFDRETIAQQTGANPADVQRLSDYCGRFGLRVDREHWRSVVIGGPIDRMIDAFGATVAVFEDDFQRRFRHRSLALHAPPEIAALVRGAFGLHQWPRSKRLPPLTRKLTPLTAAEVASRYDFPEADGSGQTIAVLQMRGSFDGGDFDRSMRAQGVRRQRPIVQSVDGAAVTHEKATMKDLEATLDVQIAGSLAPGARIVAYEAPNDERGFLDAVRDAIFDREWRPTILSISYGWPEDLWTPVALEILDELFAVAALLGISVFCSSGDDGAELDGSGNARVVAPASSPFAASCGATVIDADDNGERAWEKTGGGFSKRFEPPPWQGRARSSAMRYNVDVGRGVPDVAAQQSPGYFVIMNGTELAMGGTSAVAPVWSALIARINQRLGVPSGFFLPILYERGERAFRPVAGGDNGFFQASSGWNPCTGLGVPVGTALERVLRHTP